MAGSGMWVAGPAKLLSSSGCNIHSKFQISQTVNYGYLWEGQWWFKKTGSTVQYYLRGSGGEWLGEYTNTLSGMNYLNLYGADMEGKWQIDYPSKYFYVKDHLGNMRQTLRDDGTKATVVSTEDYYPFGSTMRSSTTQLPALDKFKYQGKERDLETGYDYFEARLYDPQLCRFMQVDPLAETFKTSNPFVGMGNNPIQLVDPTGMEIKNSGNYVLSNPKLEQKLKDFDEIIERLSGKSGTSYVFEVTGGDRYKKDGKIYSSTNNSEIVNSASNSRHLQEVGAIGVDLRIPAGIPMDVIKKAAEEAGFEQIDDDYEDGHLHLALPKSEGQEYLESNTIDKKNVPKFTRKEDILRKIKYISLNIFMLEKMLASIHPDVIKSGSCGGLIAYIDEEKRLLENEMVKLENE